MAKKSKIARNQQRAEIVAKYRERRVELLQTISSVNASEDEKAVARKKLQALPRDASPTRLRNRGFSDGRPRGYLRKFGLSRVKFREAALSGELPGVTKSSW
ncbi:MAG: 30S ribosomal protein S14 [Ancrocorticia sp.]